jgi:peptidoglycan L-alanyl-D-glutamate endopeptidase CwlK
MKMTLEKALENSSAPPEVLQGQALIELPYIDFKGSIQTGFLVADKGLVTEIKEIFGEILLNRFPIFQMMPISVFGWSDDASMEANNCSAFNYRMKVGKSSLSVHSYGRAIDINPVQNPYINRDLTLPASATYDETVIGTLLADGPIVAAFESRGWIWGGRWNNLKDFHHFEKPLEQG